ncbi:MAG: hypothetical protein M3P84_03065 [Chloroflexota bacterium]|nr:hypothetical protein [Chloroflexota bacterium]
MPLAEVERAFAAWLVATRKVAETSIDDPLRPLAERVAEDYRLRYDRMRCSTQPLGQSRRQHLT